MSYDSNFSLFRVYFSFSYVYGVRSYSFRHKNFFVGFLEGSTISFAIGAMVLGILYATGILCKVFAFKRRLLGKEDMYER